MERQKNILCGNILYIKNQQNKIHQKNQRKIKEANLRKKRNQKSKNGQTRQRRDLNYHLKEETVKLN